MKNRLIKI